METSQIILLIAVIIFIQAAVWFFLIRWMKARTQSLIQKMRERCCQESKGIVLGPQPGLYRGADAVFGNVRGNGVICLTESRLLFQKLTGQNIEIDRSEITDAAVEEWFKGKPSCATGGRHLVVKTKSGNRIGFLVRDAEKWVQAIQSH